MQVFIEHGACWQFSADGLSNSSSVAVRGHTVWVLNAAYFTHKDPRILWASLRRIIYPPG